MDDLQQIKHQLEYRFLKDIISGLRNKTIKLTEAKSYANAFLAIEPFTSYEDVEEKIEKFVSQYKIFFDLRDYLKEYEQEKSDNMKIAQMRKHIKQNDIDAALEVAKS